MENVRTIYLDWNGGVIKSEGGSQLARQYDHLSNLVIFRNAPALENYYLIVRMKEDEASEVRDMEPIQLAGPYWLVPNYYTQLAQPIIFQVCCKTENEDFEHHSAKFSMNVIESLSHDGSEIDVDPSNMFDRYKEYVDTRVDELVISGFIEVSDRGSVEVVHNNTGLLASTADRVVVLNDDGYYGSGETVTYVKSPNELNAVLNLRRSNGDYMIPEPRRSAESSEVPTKSIGDVIASYINKNDLVYGGDHGAFNVDCDGEIDCSTFAYLIMQGTDYNHSRYAGLSANMKGAYVGNNIPRSEASAFTERAAFNASEIALFFAGQNRLFYIDYNKAHPVSQLQTGDILFFTNYENARTRNRYMAVYHVAIVLQTYPESDAVLIAQAGGAIEYLKEPIGQSSSANVCNLALMYVNSSTENDCIVYARPKYGIEKSVPKQNIKYASIATNVSTPTAGNRSQLANLFFKRPLSKDRMYTLSVKGDIPFKVSEGVMMTLYVQTPGYNLHACRLLHIGSSNRAVMPFVPMENISAATAVWLTVWTPSGTGTYTQNTYSVDEISIYEGLYPDIEPCWKSIGEYVTFNSVVTVTSKYAWFDGASAHLRASLKLANAPESNGFVDIGRISTEAIPKQVFSCERFCKVGSDVRPFEISASDAGAVRVYLKTTDSANDNVIIDLDI